MHFSECLKYCEEDNRFKISEVIRNISDINNREPINGWSLLSTAAYYHSKSTVSLLLDHGANINITNFKGTSVLMYAKSKVVHNRDFDFLTYLINKGADPYLQDIYGKDILYYVKLTNDAALIDFFYNIMYNK